MTKMAGIMSESSEPMPTDALTAILRRLRLRAGIFVHARYCAPWSVDTSGQRMAPFHLIQDGNSWLHMADAEPRKLRPGDLVVLPRDKVHIMSSGEMGPSLVNKGWSVIHA